MVYLSLLLSVLFVYLAMHVNEPAL